MAILASVAILATRWCHLHQLKIGPPSSAAPLAFFSKFGQVAPLALLGFKVGHQVVSCALPLALESLIGVIS